MISYLEALAEFWRKQAKKETNETNRTYASGKADAFQDVIRYLNRPL